VYIHALIIVCTRYLQGLGGLRVMAENLWRKPDQNGAQNFGTPVDNSYSFIPIIKVLNVTKILIFNTLRDYGDVMLRDHFLGQ